MQNGSTENPVFDLTPKVVLIAAAASGYFILVKLFPYLLQAVGFQFDLFSMTYPWSFSPVMAIGMFLGAILADRRLALGVMFATLLISDIGIAVVTGHVTWAFYPLLPLTYVCLLATPLIGYALRNSRAFWLPLGAGFAACVGFFLITNFASWLTMSIYSKDIVGLLECYAAGLPFFRNMTLGTMVYTAVLFHPMMRAAVAENSIAWHRPIEETS